MPEHVQTIVIGAGVVGLAIARALALSGREVLILEREPAFGSITSARNSEVIHAGIYYPKDSLKARLCVAGRHMLYDYCAAHGIAHRRCGKLIVACSPDEVEGLGAIAPRAWDNGVDDLRQIPAAEARAMEPALACHGALHSPSTGIVDSHALMLTLLGEAEQAGAMLVMQTDVVALEALAASRSSAETHRQEPPGGATADGFLLRTGGAEPMELVADELVNAAGLGAPKLAQAMRGLPEATVPRQWIAKGNYFSLAGRAPFSRLIYPAPVAGGLGIHLTLDLSAAAAALVPTSSGSRTRTIRSTRAAARSSTTPSAATGRACPTMRWRPTMPGSGPSSRRPATPISASTAPRCTGCAAMSASTASNRPG